jgi:Fic family protein
MDVYEKAVALWRGYEIRTPADLDKYLDSFRVLFAYHSGKIENGDITYHDTREIFENGRVCGFTGTPRALFEQQNQKLCYEYLKGKMIAGEPLTVDLVREIHRTLTMGTYDERRYIENDERPGEFKKHDYVTGVHEVGSAAVDVEGDLRELLEEVAGFAAADALKAGAYLHARFEYIHPFADGNGRVGRTLLNYFLMTHNHPPLVVYDEDKASYYQALQAYDEDEEIAPLLAFLREQVKKTWEKTLAMAQADTPAQRKGLTDFTLKM